MRIWNKSVNDRLRDLSTASAKPKTVHIHLHGREPDKKLACNKSLTGEAVEILVLPSEVHRRNHGWREGGYSYYDRDQNVSGSWLLKTKYVHGKNGVRVTICRPCQSATESRLAQDAMEVLARGRGVAVQPNHGEAPDPFKDKGGVLGLLPPLRPVGTEYMTGHLDEGSAAGGCAAAGAGFRTAYLPWVTCPACLVFFDESMESELLKLRGLYVDAAK